MPGPRHTPYDGSHKPFQIGLKPLDPALWIDVDADLPAYLSEKARLLAAHPEAVFMAEPGTEAAQAELRDLLVGYLPGQFPQHYRLTESGVEVAGRIVPLDGDVPPLLTAAALVQDDLVLMRKGAQGWRLAAASLSFPSAWKLAEKFGRPMHEVHGPVPGFGAGTRNAGMIERMFDHLRPETPVIRWNWSLFGDDVLYHPEGGHPDTPRFGASTEHVFFRVERQTLRKLPASGDIVFTIRIYIDPLAALERHPDAAGIAARLIAQLDELNAEQLAYKGLAAERERLRARLAEIA